MNISSDNIIVFEDEDWTHETSPLIIQIIVIVPLEFSGDRNLMKKYSLKLLMVFFLT